MTIMQVLQDLKLHPSHVYEGKFSDIQIDIVNNFVIFNRPVTIDEIVDLRYFKIERK